MENEIAKRYRLCSNCSDRRLSGRCDGKCKEYWKYVGATEQKAIDIEKACEWLKNNWREYVNQDRDGMILFGHWEYDFRKAMEE